MQGMLGIGPKVDFKLFNLELGQLMAPKIEPAEMEIILLLKEVVLLVKVL